jgi:3-oxoacyl-[acyl-carrier protein] reductase
MTKFREQTMTTSKVLTGQRALVTGASRGIGFAIAEKLATLGADLAICARKPDPLNRAAAQLRDRGVRVQAYVSDVSRSEEIAKLANDATAALGPIDILVNNAGIGRSGPFQDLKESDWDAVLDTNLKSVFLLSGAIAHSMIERRTGHIINIASLAGKNAFAGGGIYCASKWGLLGLTYCMAEDLRAFGIRVSAICPGSVATEFSPHVGKDESKMLQPADIAHAVETIVTQAPQSFISELLLRPTQKP